MASTANSFECNYFRSHALPIPYIFSSERVELLHIKEQISSLDRHISALNALRDTLHYRSCQLHNLLSPIRILPIEILSRIFQQVIAFPENPRYLYTQYRECLSQAFILASVSAHFRNVALGTPELWRNIPLQFDSWQAVCKASSLLQHCTALAARVSVSVFDRLNKKEARSAIKILLTSGTMQKIKAFQLYGSAHAPNAWMRKLSDPSFTMLDTLSIQHPPSGSLDLGAVKTVTRLNIYGPYPSWDQPLTIIAPPSLQYLTAIDVLQQTLVSLLYQCPNLVECNAGVFIYSTLHDAAKFDEHLTLSHLKQLTLHDIRVITMPSSQNLRLPSLETLQIKHHKGGQPSGVIQLCCNASSTLTILKIHVYSESLGHDDVYQLWNVSLPKLRELEFGSSRREPLSSAIQMLALRVNKHCNTESRYLPSLVAFTLDCKSGIETPYLLDLLAKWKIGKASDFYVEVRGSHWKPQDLSLDLREELRSIVGSRRIEVTWYGSKILQLSRNRTLDEWITTKGHSSDRCWSLVGL